MLRKLVMYTFAGVILFAAFATSWKWGGASAEATVRAWDILYQKKYDNVVGSAGLSMPSSAYNGVLQISREPATHQLKADFTPKFVTRWMEVQVFGMDGDRIKTVFGLNYVYFQSNKVLKRLFDEGNLAIYRYDAREEEWVECPSKLVQKGKKFRLTCILPTFGIYGLATK